MADVTMQNSGLQGDIDEMGTAHKDMQQAITDFLDLVQANMSAFVGLSADQFTVIKNNTNKTVSEVLNPEYSNAVQALQSMKDVTNQGDLKGAQVLGG